MKILVSGTVSRHCNPAKNKKDVMVSWMLAEALREMGHEVEHRNPTIAEDYKEFDKIYLGLSAMHSVGCNRSYGFLAAYLKAKDKVVFYADDPETAKVRGGFKVWYDDPYKITKPFYVYRLEYALASQPEMHDWLQTGVEMLHKYEWPEVVVPMFAWGDIDQFRRGFPNASQVTQIDFSSYVPDYAKDFNEDAFEPHPHWVTEMKPEDRWFELQRPVYDVKHFGRGFYQRPEDAGLVHEYAKAWGVLDAGLPHGFWSSRMTYAIQARTLMVTNWLNVLDLGEPYALLSDRAVELSHAERNAWVETQADAFNEAKWTKDQVKDALNVRAYA